MRIQMITQARGWLYRLSYAAVVCGLLSSCSSTTSIPETHLATAVPPKVVPAQGTAVVAVRWPMVITDQAFSIIGPVFADKVPVGKAGLPDAYRRIPELSTYYALELYSYLREYLGRKSVLLEPYVVTADSENRLRYEPIFRNAIPVAFAVDVVEPPAWTPCCVGGIGDYLSTIFRIAVAPKESPLTCGLIGGVRHVNDGLGVHKFEVLPHKGRECTAETVRGGPHYTLMDFYGPPTDKATGSFSVADGLPLRLNSIVVWPDTTFELSMDHVRQSAHMPFSINKDKPDNPWAANVARAIAHAAAAMDLNQLTAGGLASYSSLYDRTIGNGTSRNGITNKLNAVRILAEAEKQWIAKQDEKIAHALLNGSFGKTFRQRRIVDSEIRKQRRSQSMATAMGIYGAGMNAGLFGGTAPLNTVALAQGMSHQLTESLQAQHQLLNYVQVELGPDAAARDRVIQIEIAGIARQLNVDSRAKLREQLRALYIEKFGK
jgi:hypothetical protein